MNANTIAKMTKKPLIINVARGSVVDSQAVAEAMQGKLLTMGQMCLKMSRLRITTGTHT
ncbi:MAG: NAD(P)-dependent oxidoreductase [Moraxella sp.]